MGGGPVRRRDHGCWRRGFGRGRAAGHGSSVAAQVDGQTYVLLGPSVFGVTVQQDPLAYHAIKLADGTVRGRWRYDYWQAGTGNHLQRPGDMHVRQR